MVKFKISIPIWKNRAVGIAESKITEDIEVEVLYKDVRGNRVFPYKYTMTKTLALAHPIQVVRGIRLRIIPISEFKVDGIKSDVEKKTVIQPPIFGNKQDIRNYGKKR